MIRRVCLILLPLFGVMVSAKAELIGGNYTTVTSDIAAQHRRRRRDVTVRPTERTVRPTERTVRPTERTAA
jgi:hypothetical protein